ncbi:MAG: ribonuclease PH, partial [Neisseriaceae bacterium]|nr:ribonuclease PH [Neisseriaceae bacterium]
LESVAAISVGVVDGASLLDLDYIEDSNCDSDINVVMNYSGKIIEIQGTAEQAGFDNNQLLELMSYAKSGIQILFEEQQKAIERSKIF